MDAVEQRAARRRSRGTRPRCSAAPGGPRRARGASRETRSPPRRASPSTRPMTTAEERIWKSAVATRRAVSIPSRVIIRSVKPKTPQNARAVGPRPRLGLEAVLDVALQARRDPLHVDEEAARRGPPPRAPGSPPRASWLAAREKRTPAPAHVTTETAIAAVDGAGERRAARALQVREGQSDDQEGLDALPQRDRESLPHGGRPPLPGGLDRAPGRREEYRQLRLSRNRMNRPRTRHLPQVPGAAGLEADGRAPGRLRRALRAARALRGGRAARAAAGQAQEDLAGHDLPDPRAARRLGDRRARADRRDRATATSGCARGSTTTT